MFLPATSPLPLLARQGAARCRAKVNGQEKRRPKAPFSLSGTLPV
jgi:hypothetical protein